MENIHVILCGTDAFVVEGVLQGVVEKAHFAWNKKYRFSCTNALSIDRVDSRLLLICHAIVLCRGARPPKEKGLYNGRAVVSLPDATLACVEEVRDSEFYYGPIPLAELRDAVVSIALSPSHVVYDSLLQCLTPLGEAAFQRAFWLLDRNNDGALDKEELLTWARLTRADNFGENDLRDFLTSAADVIGQCAQTRLTQAPFFKLHQHWLEVGEAEEAWATLHAVGTQPDGMPYSWYDLHSTRIDRDVNTYLSPHAIQFFRNVYKLKNFKDISDGGMWRVTPGCPWSHIDGLSGAASIPLDRFIEHWKYMALERRDAVIMYARYWGYKGDAGFLFAQRHARAHRNPDEPLPNTLQVLVVGSRSSGRKRLLFELTTDGKEVFQPRADAPLYVRTTTFYAEKKAGGAAGSEEPQSIAYTTIGQEKAEVILTTESLNRTFDITLLCIDGSDYAASAASLMEMLDRVRQGDSCSRMPFLLVVTKSDVLGSDGMPGCTPKPASPSAGRVRLPFLHPRTEPTATEALIEFAKRHRLLWPPVMTSAERPEESEITVLNEYVYAVAQDPALAEGKAPLTWVRALRRATFTAIVVVGTFGLLQKVGQWAIARRKK